MFHGITVLAGPAGCGKTGRLLAHYRGVLSDGAIGAGLWLGPAHRSVSAVRDRLLGEALTGCFSPNCLTFGGFARRVLEASPQPIRAIGPLVERRILRGLIDDALAKGKLGYFAPIAHTPGFLGLLVAFVEELKRLEIWPEEFARTGGRSEKDRELCHLYQGYQQVLTENNLYDAQGRFWSARDLLRKGQQRPFEKLRHVVVDGFADFTRTEYEILAILARRVTSLVISLPMEVGSPRNDLFAKSESTLAELQRRHPDLTVVEMPPRPAGPAAIAQVERLLFSNPRQPIPRVEAAGVEIVEAAGAVGEIELLARRIKRLLSHGDSANGNATVRPGDILVVFRSLGDAGELVRQTFCEYGIPLAIESSLPLSRAPVVSALLGWLKLDVDDWPFRQLLGVLVHNYFRPDWSCWQQGRAAVAAERITRWLQVPSGRAALESQLERLASAAPPIAGSSSRRDEWVVPAAKLAFPLIQRIGKALDALPERATIAQWLTAIETLAASLGLLRSADASLSANTADDTATWQQLSESLTDCARLSTWTNEAPVELSRREFFEQLQEMLRSEPIRGSLDESGRVRVLTAESARNLSAPYVFLAGLSENSFPAPGRDDCIWSEADTSRLISAGLPLVSRTMRSRYEMLLFYELATRATQRLILSYPALDSRAQPLSPSPYLGEVARVCGIDLVAHSAPPDLSVVPEPDDIFCPRDYRVRAVANALEADFGFMAELSSSPATNRVAENVLANLRASHERQRGEAFGTYEGMLTSDAARGALLVRFGPEHCWSASELEQYARCPYQFLLDRVLHLQPAEDPVLAVDYLARGQMLHELLATLHRKLNERWGGPRSPGDETEQALVEQIGVLLAELRADRKGDPSLASGLREIDARQLAVWLSQYRLQHAKYDAATGEWERPLRPAYFEVSFGPGHQGADLSDEVPREVRDALSTSNPFHLVCAQETIRFTGRIDRIDVGMVSGQHVFSIVDYKSGASARANAKAIQEGYALQLPIYAMAAAELLSSREAVPFHAGYWNVAGSGFKEAISFHTGAEGNLRVNQEWEALREQLRGRIRSLVEGIRQGQFPMHSADEECTSRCEYSTICRVNQVRALNKLWQAPVEGIE